MLASVGFASAWPEVLADHRGQYLKSNLDALVARRNDVAHGKMTATVAPTDIATYLDDMRELAERTDVVVAEWLENVHNRKNPWGLLL